MRARHSYQQQLRNIGQALDGQGINVFGLTHDNERYRIKGDRETDSSVWTQLRRWARCRGSGRSVLVEYAGDEIARLERKGRRKRSRADRLPEFYTVSSVLRTVGAYLDARGARLIELQKSSLTVTFLYRNRDGGFDFEERSIASFYPFFLQLHSQRARPQPLTTAPVKTSAGD